MKFLTALCLLATSTLWALDAETIRSSIYKITSKSPGTAKELRGSGILFTKDSKFYMLTSDHVVVHTNDAGSVHSATNSVSGQKLTLIFRGSEWGLGLALLEVYKPAANLKAPRFEDLIAPSGIKAGDAASFYGYPYESAELTEETGAKVVNTATALPYFVFAPALYEFDALIGEFGMSGGGAFNAQGGFLGILAYQRILNGTEDNRVYSIPQKLVTDWLTHYFQELEKYKPVFSEPWWGQGQPEQVMLTNDGYFFAFRAFNGEVRMAGARMEALLILKDGPSIRYEDSRGLLKAFRADLDKNVMAPAEFSLIDRSLTVPALISVQYPAFAISSLNRNGVSLFIARGERHELRYGRFKPKVDQLEKDVTTAKASMSADLSESFGELLKRLKAIPPKPTDPGTAGASEFFSSNWLGNTVLQFEQNSKLAGWASLEKSAPNEAKKLRETVSQLIESLNVLEIKGRN